MYATTWCPDCHRTKYFLDQYGVDYVEVDVESNPEAMAFVKQVNDGRRVVPTIVFPDGDIMVEPPLAMLAQKLDLEV